MAEGMGLYRVLYAFKLDGQAYGVGNVVRLSDKTVADNLLFENGFVARAPEWMEARQ